MINKKQYLDILQYILSEHYNIMHSTNKIMQDRQQFIDGYITAAMALDAFDRKELQTFMEKIHFEVFGMTIKERLRTKTFENGTADDFLAVPAYIRKGIELAF
ncbi:MAG TPA: hypothetical protein PLR24_10970 [Saprospiraceae bacterium]|nr:hypothetical protein [Saprospiraceae bacterium]